MEKIYSNKIWMAFLHFMEKKYGREMADNLLAEMGVDRLALADANGFQTTEFGVRLIDCAIRLTGQRDISYQSGRDLAESLGKVGGFMVGLTSPSMCMKLMGQIESKLALKTITRTQSIGPNQYRVDISFKDGFREPESACQNRIGSYESLPRFFGLPFGKVDHPKCAFRGDSHCEYVVTFPESRFLWFKKLGLTIGLSAVILGAMGLSMGKPSLEYGAALCLVAGLGCYTFYKHWQAQRFLEWTLLANEGLSDQMRQLAKNNAQIGSLQGLTLALGRLLRVNDICEEIVTTLVRDFGYGSSQIWLADEATNTLSNRAAHGYSADLTAFIRNTRFEIGRDWDNPYGLLVQTLEHGQTILVNDVPDAVSKLTSRTREFIVALKPSSFIITPLVHNKLSIGILTAEHHGEAKLDNKDKLLFLSISNIVANALVKADLFEKMEQKIAQRGRELEAASRQLMTAKEMAIQSEKLSSLGQMAAGVAHEINNPLNFLVNIIPDVRRDVNALEKIKDLAKASGNAALVAKVDALERESDLDSHLAEKDFVFDRIQKALDKSTRIANSLKVFSRSSAKEKITRESLAGMIKEVVELIPQKIRGDAVIDVVVPSGLDWEVNKNEMEQAFLALINNAIEAMGQKGRLEIRAESRNGDIVMAFKDQGPGIPEESLKKIFNPFYTTKPPGKGTGLGLTIASEIVRKYGAVLTAESKVGEGATFIVKMKKAAG